MTEWANLRDAYGSATNIPTLITAWADAPSDEGLQELWGRLCHQGTVYSTSFEAIPLLTNACALVPEKEQRNALMLAAAILASNDHHDGATPSEATLKLMPVLEKMLTARMSDSDVDAMESPYLLAALAAFRSDMFWGRNLDCLASGEFAGACPRCGSPFYLVVYWSRLSELSWAVRIVPPVEPPYHSSNARVIAAEYGQSLEEVIGWSPRAFDFYTDKATNESARAWVHGISSGVLETGAPTEMPTAQGHGEFQIRDVPGRYYYRDNNEVEECLRYAYFMRSGLRNGRARSSRRDRRKHVVLAWKNSS